MVSRCSFIFTKVYSPRPVSRTFLLLKSSGHLCVRQTNVRMASKSATWAINIDIEDDVRAKSKSKRPKKSFLKALESKYSNHEEAQPLKYVQIVFHGKPKSDEKSELGYLRNVVLTDSNISIAGLTERSLRDTCPHVVDLDISGNLFDNWKSVLTIVSQLDNLKYLNLSRNPLKLGQKSLTEWTDPLPNVENLVLNGTEISWTDVLRLTEMFKQLTELHICGNGYKEIPDCDHKGLESLETLRLNNNKFQSWEQIWKLKHLPRLKSLILSGNPLEDVFFHGNDLERQCSCSSETEMDRTDLNPTLVGDDRTAKSDKCDLDLDMGDGTERSDIYDECRNLLDSLILGVYEDRLDICMTESIENNSLEITGSLLGGKTAETINAQNEICDNRDENDTKTCDTDNLSILEKENDLEEKGDMVETIKDIPNLDEEKVEVICVPDIPVKVEPVYNTQNSGDSIKTHAADIDRSKRNESKAKDTTLLDNTQDVGAEIMEPDGCIKGSDTNEFKFEDTTLSDNSNIIDANVIEHIDETDGSHMNKTKPAEYTIDTNETNMADIPDDTQHAECDITTKHTDTPVGYDNEQIVNDSGNQRKQDAENAQGEDMGNNCTDEKMNDFSIQDAVSDDITEGKFNMEAVEKLEHEVPIPLCSGQDRKQQPFQNLENICLSETKIGKWKHLSALSSFPALTSLRIKEIKLGARLTQDDRRKLFVPCLPNIKTLNGSEVTLTERDKGERYFLRYFCDKPKKPAVYSVLEKKHGTLSPLVDIDICRGYQELVTLTFYYLGEVVFKETVNVRQPVGRLRLIIADKLCLYASLKNINMYHKYCNPQHQSDLLHTGELEQLVLDTLPISRFDIMDGDEIHVDIYDRFTFGAMQFVYIRNYLPKKKELLDVLKMM